MSLSTSKSALETIGLKLIKNHLPEIVANIVEAYIYRKTGKGIKYLLIKRSADVKYPGLWQMAGGRIEDNEKAYETAIREITEETSLTIAKLYVLPVVSSFYRPDTDSIHLTPAFLAEAKGKSVTLSHEHTEYKWLNYKQARKLLHWKSWKYNLKTANKILSSNKLFNKLEEIKITN